MCFLYESRWRKNNVYNSKSKKKGMTLLFYCNYSVNTILLIKSNKENDNWDCIRMWESGIRGCAGLTEWTEY